eukprot:scaffold1954_cov268-Pinguiococcus_pyrenoidosus.AAC.155
MRQRAVLSGSHPARPNESPISGADVKEHRIVTLVLVLFYLDATVPLAHGPRAEHDVIVLRAPDARDAPQAEDLSRLDIRERRDGLARHASAVSTSAFGRNGSAPQRRAQCAGRAFQKARENARSKMLPRSTYPCTSQGT